MASLSRLWRKIIPARVSEVLAAFSVLTTFLLFIHTNHLQNQLQIYANQMGGTLEVGRSESRTQATAGPGHVFEDSNHASLQRTTWKTPYKQYNVLDYRKLDLLSLNNTVKHSRLTMMFNRVPKVGSQSTMELLRALSYKNGFTFHKDRPQKTETIMLTVRDQKRLIELVDVFRPPAVYVKHVCYINFTEFNFTQPIYVNMVRDPVERAISWYYYVRAPWYFIERKKAFPDLPFPSSEWLRKDYETCVKSMDEECQYREGDERPDFAQLTEFFCGQDKRCTGFNSDFALRRAKENVERHYAVVGVLEDMNMTLTVLEHYIPRFFIGAKDLYWKQIHRFSQVNRNIYKPPVTEEVKDIVRRNFTREIEFYEFCRQRLHMQYGALNLPVTGS